jgi:hypothetical protein
LAYWLTGGARHVGKKLLANFTRGLGLCFQ